MNATHAAARIKALARELGFDACRIAAAGEAPHAAAFREWLAAGCFGGMQWLARQPGRRCDPRVVLPGCRSVVCLALNYFTGGQRAGELAGGTGRIARYALNHDYHAIIEPMLGALDDALRGLGGVQRCCVDHGPVLERDFASAAGLGWNGKSTLQVHRRLGTWFFLAEVLTTVALAADRPAADHCGRCTRCLAACPTGALTGPRQLDARRCIAYLTIEHHGPIPEDLRRAVGDRIFGCDECLAACPWNRFAAVTRDARLHARASVSGRPLRELLGLDEARFRALFEGSPVLRLKLPRLLRNACVALGNRGGAADLPALAAAALHPDPLVAEHARWAIREIEGRTGGRAAAARAACIRAGTPLDWPPTPPVKAHQIYQQMAPELLHQMLDWFREKERSVYKTTLATLAKDRKLRLVFVQRKPLPEQYAWIHKTLQLRSCDTVGEQLLQAWFLAGHQPLLAAFCDEMGIPHDGKGSVEGDLPAELDAPKLDAAVDKLLESVDPRLLSLYLHTFNLQVPGGWQALGAKLAADERLRLFS